MVSCTASSASTDEPSMRLPCPASATLSAYGNPTHRTEGVIRLIAELEGCSCEVFAVPTGLWLSVRGPGHEPPVVRMARVKEWTVNLDRLAAVDRIFNDVIERKL